MPASVTFKRFPPSSGTLLVPRSSRADALAGLALYPSCRPRAIRAHRVSRLAVTLAGPAALPGPDVEWTPDPQPDAWGELVERWREAVGVWESWAVLERSQPGARGCAMLLLRRGRPLAFAKVRPEPQGLEVERRALEAVAASEVSAFRAPRVLAAGEAGGWHWLLTEAVPLAVPRRPDDPDLDAILGDVDTALGEWPRPEGTPPTWRPMHGDFTPWNLRRTAAGGRALLDWEAVAWGPPGADRVLYVATRTALGGKPERLPEGMSEAIEHWRGVVARRGGGPRDRRLAADLERALATMAPAPARRPRRQGPRRGVWLAVLGPDGSGKSSVLDRIEPELVAEMGEARRFHLRPHFGRGDDDAQPVPDPHGRPPRGTLPSLAKLAVWWLDYWIGYATRIRPALSRSTAVLFDRYYHDLLVDPRRYRYGGPARAAALVGRSVPMPHSIVVLDASVDVLRARKPEVEPVEIARQREAYRHLASRLPNARVIDAARPLDRVVEEVRELALGDAMNGATEVARGRVVPRGSGALLWGAVALIAGLIALGILVRPALAAGGVAGLAALTLALFAPRRFALGYMAGLGLLLLGYAAFGRGFAYLGAPPVFVGEVALGLGLIAVLAVGGLGRVFRSPVAWVLIAFVAWGAARTVPFLGVHGADALRDAALWGYAAFAVLVAALLLRTGLWGRIPEAYASVLPWLLAWLPIGLAVSQLLEDRLPRLPGGSASLFEVKPGDAAVHLAGIGTFLLLGLYAERRRSGSALEWVWWGLWLVGVAVAASQNRGGMLAVGAALALVLVLRPGARWLKLTLPALVLVLAAVTIDLRVDLGGRREVSARQVARNAWSLTEEAGGERLHATADWRLRWWEDIVGYTVSGEYFWTGKGYGVNLATADGYQVREDRSLRSPHNGHVTVLARSGVPGFALWLLLHGAFVTALLAAYSRARSSGDEAWARFDLWLLAFYTAFMVNASFDVFLEGPQGGIWFWSLMGVGIAALEAQRRPVEETG